MISLLSAGRACRDLLSIDSKGLDKLDLRSCFDRLDQWSLSNDRGEAINTHAPVDCVVVDRLHQLCISRKPQLYLCSPTYFRSDFYPSLLPLHQLFNNRKSKSE